MNLLLGRPVARLLAKELLAGAAESGGARAVFGTADEVIEGVGVPMGGPTRTHAFWQVMTWVLQPTRQAVDVCDWINGVGTSGTG